MKTNNTQHSSVPHPNNPHGGHRNKLLGPVCSRLRTWWLLLHDAWLLPVSRGDKAPWFAAVTLSYLMILPTREGRQI